MIRLEHVTKRYGRLTAVDNLSLTIEKGAIFGFIGPNGAGKTTTMKILCALLEPTAAERVEIAGVDVLLEPRRARRHIGYMPDFFGVYDDLKTWEYLDFFGAAFGLSRRERKRRGREVLALTHLESKEDAMVDSLSRGMKQRLCLAKTLLHDPSVLILDEPASGLDPHARIEMRETLKRIAGTGKTIFISSHILTELSGFCTVVGILERGKLLYTGAPERASTEMIANEAGEKIPHHALRLKSLNSSTEDLKRLLMAIPTVVKTADAPDGAVRIVVKGEQNEIAQVLRTLIEKNEPIIQFVEEKGDLEDVFLSVTTGAVQ